MNKLLVLLLVTLFALPAAYADQDPDAIARALAERLEDALDFDPGDEDPQTTRRKVEDENAMWLMMYVRPRQNLHFPRFHAMGFRTGLINRNFVAIPDISKRNAFYLRHDSPWSIEYNGIGRIYLYKETNFKRLTKILSSTDDHSKKETFGVKNNAPRCICSHHFPNCVEDLCGKRKVIGSVKFDPGIAFYSNTDYRGEAQLLTPGLYSREDITPGKTFCLPASRFVRKAKSMHFDALVDRVKVYRSSNCTGASASYTWNKQKGTVRSLATNFVGSIKSVQIKYRWPFELQ
jgi:hypothetical protein